MFLSPYRIDRVYKDSLAHRPPHFEIAAGVTVIVTDDIQAGLDQIKQNVGFYVGGMGAKSFNVHKDHIGRLGFADAAQEIQDLFMSGKRDDAMAAVPNELADEISLVGPKERIRERLQAWKDSDVTSLTIGTRDMETLEFMAEELA